MAEFSGRQIVAAKEAVDVFGTVCYVMLLAQMQSGKTETFLLTACELIRLGLVRSVVIFSGNSEVDLRKQLDDQIKGRSKFIRKYKKFLRNNGMDDEDEREEFIESVIPKISIVWGSELDSYTGPTTDTLFIWEESHYAQSQKQRPDKFLKSIGISADGNVEVLQRNRNLMMTISATPFSELSDNLRLGQGKHIVKMEPGDGYVSVKIIRDSGRLKTFKNYTDGIRVALSLPKDGNKYAIARITTKSEETIRRIAGENGWKCVVFDSIAKGKEREEGEKVWNSMENAPAVNTLILIRGKCRMGKNLEKKHLSFVIETAKMSKTDTVLQSLLGRVCGYSEGSDKVMVYLSEKIVRSGEIDRYVEMWETPGVTVIPTNACNMTTKKVTLNVPIPPIAILSRRISNNRNDVIQDVREALLVGGDRIMSSLSASKMEQVRNKFIGNKSSDLNCRYLTSKDNHVSRARDILSAFQSSTARQFGENGCVNEKEIKIWIMKSVPGVDKNIIYITTVLPREDMRNFKIPTTTGREAFSGVNEEVEVEVEVIPIPVVDAVAVQVDDIPVAVAIAIQVVEDCDMDTPISQSKPFSDETSFVSFSGESFNSCAYSSLRNCPVDAQLPSDEFYDEPKLRYEIIQKVMKTQKIENIYVTPAIYANLKKGGITYNYVFDLYKETVGQTVKLQTKKGRTPKLYEARGLIKIDTISW